jgi:CRISPR-associated protein Cas2
MRNIVLAYDITDDKRRLKLFKTLEGFGTPVQLSVFECSLSDTNLLIMKRKVEKIIKKEDSVILYELCPRCLQKIERLGTVKRVLQDDVIVV